MSYPSEWLDFYTSRKYYRIDPIIKEHITHFNLCFWNDIYKVHNLPEELISLTEDFGLKRGCTHGMKNPKKGEGSLFSFSGDSIEYTTRTEIILEHIIPHLHSCLQTLIGQHNGKQDITLSPREKEVLNWIKVGKSSWDISVILGISERTVNFHNNNIKEKLGVISRAHAVAVALEQGLIEIE